MFYLYPYTDYYKQANYRQFQTMEFSQVFNKLKNSNQHFHYCWRNKQKLEYRIFKLDQTLYGKALCAKSGIQVDIMKTQESDGHCGR